MSARLRFVPLVICACVAGCGYIGASSSALVAHAFDSSAEGWRIAGDTGEYDPDFRPEGGQSGGYIAADDEAVGETWYFSAPARVLSQLPAALGGSLRYSLKRSPAEPAYPDDDVVIVGPAGRLSYRFASAPGAEWTEFSVELSAAAGWRWNWNAVATEAQIQSVLDDASRLEIRGEYLTGPDEGGMDTFVLNGPGA